MEELPVITVMYEIYKKLLHLNTTLDKKYRHTIGESAIESCSQTIEQLLLAKHAPKSLKIGYLIKADALAEVTALKIRAILELKLANETNLLKLQSRLTEARRMLGGWRKSVSSI